MGLTAQQVASAYCSWVESGDSALVELSRDDAYDHVSGTRGTAILAVVGRWMEQTFEQRRTELHAAVQDGDRILLWLTITGVHVGNGFPRLAGLPIERREVAWPQLHVFRVEADQLVEHWAVRDDFALIEALQVQDGAMDRSS